MRSQDLTRALKGVLLTTVLGCALALGFGSAYDDGPAKTVGAIGLLAIPCIWWLVQRGWPTAGAIGLLALFNALTVYALVFGGGVQDPTAMLFPIMIITSGILLDRKLSVGASAVLVVSCIGVGIAELTGVVETRLSPLLSTSDVIFLAILILVVAGLVFVLSRALRDSVQRAFFTHQSYEQIFNATGEGIVVHEADRGEVVDVNDSALAMFGFERDERASFTIEALVGATPAFDRATLLSHLEEARKGRSSYEWCVLHRDGHPVFVDVTMQAARVQGHTRVVSVLRDTSERRVLQEQVHQAEKLRAVGQLARGVAHDFNNQLTVILANASLLEDGVGHDENLSEYAQAIIQSSRRSADLTQQLLAFARKGQRQYELIDIDALVGDVKALLARSIDKRIDVLHERSTTPAVTRGDATFLQNALLNLGLNARDAMPEGGRLHLVVEAGATATDPGDITIRIEDTGCGMSPEVRAQIFEPFYTTKAEGNGMGLAAVYGTVVAHDGSISVESEPGRGTTFTIRLPAAEVESAPTARSREGETARRFDGTRVLIAEDEAAVARITARILGELGCEVTLVEDGRTALSALEAADDAEKERFDVALLDHSMPHMTGSEVLQSVRDAGNRIPIISMSGYTEASDSPLEHQPDAFLAKPFNLAALSRVLDDVLSRDAS